jgi:hypothetical protein
LFHAAGISITLRDYPCGHTLGEQMLGDMNRWIMDEVTGRHDAFLTADSPSELAQ